MAISVISLENKTFGQCIDEIWIVVVVFMLGSLGRRIAFRSTSFTFHEHLAGHKRVKDHLQFYKAVTNILKLFLRLMVFLE